MINARVKTLCPGKEDDEKKDSASSEMEIALELQQMQFRTDEYLADAYRMFLVVNAALLGIAFLGRLIPIPLYRVASIAAQAAQTQVAGMLGRTISQQAAANDARFLIDILVARSRLAA